LNSLLKELGYEQKCVTIYEDNEGCINLSKNPQEFKRTRQIQVKYHFIRQHVRDNKIKLVYTNKKDQLADFHTKGMQAPKLQDLLNRVGLYQATQHGRELELPRSVLLYVLSLNCGNL
jgi:peptide deformylase